jgi:hypothetical protein
MTDDCFEFEVKSEIWEVFWNDEQNTPQHILVFTNNKQVAIDKVKEYCENHKQSFSTEPRAYRRAVLF